MRHSPESGCESAEVFIPWFLGCTLREPQAAPALAEVRKDPDARGRRSAIRRARQEWQRARAGLRGLHALALVDGVYVDFLESADLFRLSLTDDEVRLFQEQMREGINTLFPRPTAHRRRSRKRLVKVAALRTWLSPGSARWIGIVESHGRLCRIDQARWPETVWLGFIGVLTSPAHDWRPCAECGGLFLKVKRQAYCSRACSQRVRSARWYSQNREKAKKRRREAYARWKKRRLGPNVKVRHRD